MPEYQILFWRDIPVQIRVTDGGRRTLSRELPLRYQMKVDAIAMKEGLTGTDEYLRQWHWSPRQQREGTFEEVASAVVMELTGSDT